MITDAGNKCADSLLELAKKFETSAQYSANDYASTDNKSSQASFKTDMDKAALVRKLHTEICTFLHAVEREMTDRLKQEHV